jgi:hypothetical protein
MELVHRLIRYPMTICHAQKLHRDSARFSSLLRKWLKPALGSVSLRLWLPLRRPTRVPHNNRESMIQPFELKWMTLSVMLSFRYTQASIV